MGRPLPDVPHGAQRWLFCAVWAPEKRCCPRTKPRDADGMTGPGNNGDLVLESRWGRYHGAGPGGNGGWARRAEPRRRSQRSQGQGRRAASDTGPCGAKRKRKIKGESVHDWGQRAKNKSVSRVWFLDLSQTAAGVPSLRDRPNLRDKGPSHGTVRAQGPQPPGQEWPSYGP